MIEFPNANVFRPYTNQTFHIESSISYRVSPKVRLIKFKKKKS